MDQLARLAQASIFLTTSCLILAVQSKETLETY